MLWVVLKYLNVGLSVFYFILLLFFFTETVSCKKGVSAECIVLTSLLRKYSITLSALTVPFVKGSTNKNPMFLITSASDMIQVMKMEND